MTLTRTLTEQALDAALKRYGVKKPQPRVKYKSKLYDEILEHIEAIRNELK